MTRKLLAACLLHFLSMVAAEPYISHSMLYWINCDILNCYVNTSIPKTCVKNWAHTSLKKPVSTHTETESWPKTLPKFQNQKKSKFIKNQEENLQLNASYCIFLVSRIPKFFLPTGVPSYNLIPTNAQTFIGAKYTLYSCPVRRKLKEV